MKLPPLKTDPKLLALLERAKSLPPMTREQLEAQRRSWVIGEMMLEHEDMSKAEVEAIYDSLLGPPPLPSKEYQE